MLSSRWTLMLTKSARPLARDDCGTQNSDRSERTKMHDDFRLSCLETFRLS